MTDHETYFERIIALVRRAKAHAVVGEIDEGLERFREALQLILIASVTLDRGDERAKIMAMLRVAVDPWDKKH
jgi:hypothetical protein